MIWTSEKLNEFKHHFTLGDKEMGRGLGVTANMVWKMRNGHAPVDKISARITGYVEAVRAGRIREAEMTIEYFRSFKED